MTASEILSLWAKYSEYDENQTRFNLMSTNYWYHEAGKKMTAIMQFDPTGTMAVLYAKRIFMDTCKACKVKVFDLLENPDYLAADRKMWDIFMSEDVASVESHILNGIDSLVQQVISVKELGERNKEKEKEALYNSIETVVEELTSCHEEVYLTSGKPITPVAYYSTNIHVFRRMSECILAIERPEVKDGMYLCFIRNGDSADCCFAFVIKNNGNLFTGTERVTETFPGQHAHSRNARWSEAKKYKLFPYDYIFSYGDHDYLGYATSQVIDDTNLAFFNLGPDVYLPLLLAMACISNKYAGTDLSGKEPLMIDTMFKWNLACPSPAQTALVVPTDSAIAVRSMEYTIPFDSDGIRDWTYGKEHYWKNVPTEKQLQGFPTGTFAEEQNLFDKLYGDGFVFDPVKVLVTDPHLRDVKVNEEYALTDPRRYNDSLVPHAEFITRKSWFDLIAYQQGRKQLAEYIRAQMRKELVEFGGADAINDWCDVSIKNRHDKILDYCVEKYQYLKNGGNINVTDPGWTSCDNNILSCISMRTDDKYARGVPHPFNSHYTDKYGRQHNDQYIDADTKALCTIEFVFSPRNEAELVELFGPVPKILMGWRKSGEHGYAGNSLLDITDPVAEIGNICETHEQEKRCNKEFFRYSWNTGREYKDKIVYPRTDFSFAVSFSKNGFKKFLKERNV